MSVGEVLEMPASEYMGWQAYFSIYPFTQDREDFRSALLVTAIRNMAGRTLKSLEGVEDHLPDYLGGRAAKRADGPSLVEQRKADIAFGQRLRAMAKQTR